MRVTLSNINRALAGTCDRRLEGVELVRGNGYFYFSGGETCRWYGTAVWTPRLTCMTVDGWVREALRLSEEGR